MKKISAENLFEAMGGIGDDLLERSEQTLPETGTVWQAGETKQKRVRAKNRGRRVVPGVLALAAVLLLGIGVTRMMRGSMDSASSTSAPAAGQYARVTEESAEEDAGAPAEQTEGAEENGMMLSPAMAEEAAETESALTDEAESAGTDGIAADMNLFFFHDGRIYTEAETIAEGEYTAGDYVLTAKGDQEEWNGGLFDTPGEGSGSAAGDVYTVTGESPEEVLCMRTEDGLLLFRAEKE